MSTEQEVEVVFEPQPEGGFTVYSPDLPGIPAWSPRATRSTRPPPTPRRQIELYVESMREQGKQVPLGVVRPNFAIPA